MFARKLWERLESKASQLSTPPHYESYAWGREHSIVAGTLYRSFFLLRLLSPLQWFKYWQRRKSTESLNVRGDRDRIDFHARDTEKYLLAKLGFALICAFAVRHLATIAGWSGGIAVRMPAWPFQAVCLWLYVESVCWTFYYLLFRALIERRFDIYDEAEYFILLPIVFANQTLLLYSLFLGHATFVGVVSMLFNGPFTSEVTAVSAGTKISLFVLGQTYLVLIVANLIRVVPSIPVRRRPNITIVGYGDVVKHRLLPALLCRYSPKQLAVATDWISPEDKRDLYQRGIACKAVRTDPGQPAPDTVDTLTAYVRKRSSFAIIAVPTNAHLEYILRLARLGIRFAVEKPIVFSEAELRLLEERADPAMMNRCFLLSYYWLEKALTLNYILTLNPAFRELISFADYGADDGHSASAIAGRVRSLGRLQSIAVDLIEGPETEQRFWSELRSNGGMVAETLIHPMTLVMNIAKALSDDCREEASWSSEPEVRWFRDRERAVQIRRRFAKDISATFLEIRGTLQGNLQVHIQCGKYVTDRRAAKRSLIATCENGYITVDLDQLVTRIFQQDQCVLTAKNKRNLTHRPDGGYQKYEHQVALLNYFFNGDWSDLRFDDYPSQLRVIRQLTRVVQLMPADDEIGACDISRDELTTFLLNKPLIPAFALTHPASYAYPQNFMLPDAASIKTSSP